MTRLRWRIASALDRLPWFCWADLASWAIDGKVKDEPGEYLTNAKQCRSEGEESHCWCAKFCTAEFREKHLVPATAKDGT